MYDSICNEDGMFGYLVMVHDDHWERSLLYKVSETVHPKVYNMLSVSITCSEGTLTHSPPYPTMKDFNN